MKVSTLFGVALWAAAHSACGAASNDELFNAAPSPASGAGGATAGGGSSSGGAGSGDAGLAGGGAEGNLDGGVGGTSAGAAGQGGSSSGEGGGPSAAGAPGSGGSTASGGSTGLTDGGAPRCAFERPTCRQLACAHCMDEYCRSTCQGLIDCVAKYPDCSTEQDLLCIYYLANGTPNVCTEAGNLAGGYGAPGTSAALALYQCACER